jgi:RND family efflux transporter MFP subunit
MAGDLSEQVEGGFGGGLQPIEGAKVTARITTAAGQSVAGPIATHAEGTGSHGVHYAFRDSGEYKVVFDVVTGDNRQFSADFPVSVVTAPVNWIFWLGLAVIVLLSAGTIFGYYGSWKRDGLTARTAARKTLPVAAVALAFFAVTIIALAYFEPPRERRVVAELPPAGTETHSPGESTATGDPSLGGSGAVITISKESQSLFGIRTAVIEQRQIVSGLKVTGVVKAKPNAKSIVSPPVSGRVFFNSNLTIGTVVGRGQRVGTLEQVIGAPEQANLEAQRTSLRTAALEQQGRQAGQIALAQQARSRLAQAERELRRASNLVEIGAAPRKRVEEAQTAVNIAKQEVAAAEAQARVAGQQTRLAQESVKRVEPVRTFPLTAPVTGVVNEMKATTGQQVEAGAELLNIVNLSTVFLEAKVFEKDLPIVRESRRASYTATGIPGEAYRIGEGGDGRLVTIGQTVDPQTRTVSVIYEVPNPLNRLRDGMFVEMTVDTTGGQSVLSVPKQAVVTEQGKTFVYVFKGGEQFEKRVVVIGSEGQDFYEIKQGLKEGERVVVEGIYQLRSTQPGA